MPYYKLTGYHSHRHPFLGTDSMSVQMAGPGNEGDLVNLDNPLVPGVYEALAQDAPAQPVSITNVARPFIAGLAGGLIVYGIARRYATPKAAAQIGLVFGGSSILLGLVSDYIYREVQAIQAAPGTAVSPIPIPGEEGKV